MALSVIREYTARDTAWKYRMSPKDEFGFVAGFHGDGNKTSNIILITATHI